MKKSTLFFSVLLIITSCSGQIALKNADSVRIENDLGGTNIFKPINDNGKSVESRFNIPEGYTRIELDSNSFGFYLRNFQLHDTGRSVKLYNGQLKGNQHVHCAVLNQDLDPVDLQQCADAVMRLRGEFLFSQKKFKEIKFNFVSDNKPRYFLDHSQGEVSYKSFRRYMRHVFSYANTASLKKELISVSIKEILPGDVFIQSGNPYGHAVIVMDVAQNDQGERIFLLAQSYMPAQETHILINPSQDISPWYNATEDDIRTPEWLFKSTDLKRFP
jgi:hypothetical protein